MKTTILHVKKRTNVSVSVDEAVWKICINLGSTTDPSIRKWASKLIGKPITPAEFKHALADAKAVIRADGDTPGEFKHAPIVTAITIAANRKRSTLPELVKELKRMRYWRSTTGDFLKRKIEGVTEKALKSVIRRYTTHSNDGNGFIVPSSATLRKLGYEF